MITGPMGPTGFTGTPRFVRARLACLVVGLALLSSCQGDGPVAPDPGLTDPGVLATGYGITDGIEVIGEEEFLFIERSGVLHHYLNGTVTEVSGIPRSRMSDVWGGLLDVSLHPDFENNRLVYIAYNDASYDLAVARFELGADRANNLKVIYAWDEFSIGSRFAWEDASHFFLSFGIGGDPFPDPGPQNLSSGQGKIHRLMEDGQIPSDNPQIDGATGPSTVWSYGHRNPQGLHFDATHGVLYANEHGPLGGDELNVVTAGGNYGWPLFSYGLNYDGTAVSAMTPEEASSVSILPTKVWGPDFRVAPSGLLLVEGSAFPAWKGSFLMGALNPQHLLRYDPATDLTEIVARGIGRVRDVAQLPSGKLLIAIDGGSPTSAHRGRIVEFVPGGAL